MTKGLPSVVRVTSSTKQYPLKVTNTAAMWSQQTVLTRLTLLILYWLTFLTLQTLKTAARLKNLLRWTLAKRSSICSWFVESCPKSVICSVWVSGFAKASSYNSRSFGVWRSLVAHLHGVQGVEGSNPFTPTNCFLIEIRSQACGKLTGFLRFGPRGLFL